MRSELPNRYSPGEGQPTAHCSAANRLSARTGHAGWTAGIGTFAHPSFDGVARGCRQHAIDHARSAVGYCAGAPFLDGLKLGRPPARRRGPARSPNRPPLSQPHSRLPSRPNGTRSRLFLRTRRPEGISRRTSYSRQWLASAPARTPVGTRLTRTPPASSRRHASFLRPPSTRHCDAHPTRGTSSHQITLGSQAITNRHDHKQLPPESQHENPPTPTPLDSRRPPPPTPLLFVCCQPVVLPRVPGTHSHEPPRAGRSRTARGNPAAGRRPRQLPAGHHGAPGTPGAQKPVIIPAGRTPRTHGHLQHRLNARQPEQVRLKSSSRYRCYRRNTGASTQWHEIAARDPRCAPPRHLPETSMAEPRHIQSTTSRKLSAQQRNSAARGHERPATRGSGNRGRGAPVLAHAGSGGCPRLNRSD